MQMKDLTVEEIKRIQLQPDEILVVRFPGPMSGEQMDRVRKFLEPIFEGAGIDFHRVIIADIPIEFTKISMPDFDKAVEESVNRMIKRKVVAFP